MAPQLSWGLIIAPASVCDWPKEEQGVAIELKIPFHCIVDRKRLAFSCYTSRRASLPRRGLWKCQKFDSLLLTLLLLKVIEVAAAVCCCCSNEVEKLCLSSSYASSSRLWIRRRRKLQKPFLSSLEEKFLFARDRLLWHWAKTWE